MLKTVYFVRHGETEANAAGTVQGATGDDGLTELGQRQAQVIAERAQNIEFNALLSSDMRRAKDTAAAIAKVTDMDIEFSELFREVRWPSQTVGRRYDDTETVRFLRSQHENVTKAGWRYSDEENFDDVLARAHKAIALLEAHPKESVLVVTHGQFLRFMVALILMNKTLTPENWFHLKDAMKTTNTGVTVCQLEEYGQTRWRLLTWNDHAHFAE